ncbi:MAG: CBM9 family sugar-binding protein, partial [Sedimentisphaerales bacterium]
MSKRLIFLTCLVILCCATASTYAADADIPKMGLSPVIDGELEMVWLLCEEHPLTSYVSGSTDAADCSGTWRACWDDENLYVFFDVKDDELISDSTGKYDDDSVEVFVDIGDDDEATYTAGANDYQYRFAWDATEPAVGMDHGDTTNGILFTMLTNETGYTLEAALPWSLLFQGQGGPAVGDLMGFEMQINDDDDGGTRDTQLCWIATTNDTWQNPSLMGTVTLSVGSVSEAVWPYPPDKATDVDRDVVLTWTPGASAATHNLFLGTDFNDVNDATITNPLSANSIEALDVNNFSPGRLEFDTTYYWRVDEVNAPSTPGTFKGQVWSFTVEPFARKVP